MAMMMLACVTGSVLISKTSFMGRRGSNDGRNLKKGRRLEGECWRSSYERKEPGTMAPAYVTASPWFLVKGENLVVREVSSTKEITFYRSTKWTKDRPTHPLI